MAKPLNEMLDSAIENINELVDSSKVIGSPIRIDDKTMIVPITKVTYGFGTGGSEFNLGKKQGKNDYSFEMSQEQYPFGGGTLGGITMNPEGFISISDGKVELLKIEHKSDFFDILSDVLRDYLKNNKNK